MSRLWHRLRGHKIEPFTRNVDTSVPFMGRIGILIEKGRIERGFVCSCGKRWLT